MTYRPQSYGKLSTANTSTASLGISATFTGGGELSDFPDVMVSCTTDQAGTLFFEFSNDGVTWSTFPVAGFDVGIGIHEFHTAVKGPRYFRPRYVNGSLAQGSFALYTYLGAYSKAPNAPINQGISSDSDAAIVKAVLVGQDLTMPGTFLNVESSPAGALIVADFLTEVALGRVNGYKMGTKFGRNPLVNIGTPEDIVGSGGDYAGFPTSNLSETVHAFSSDANDSSAGTGARTVRITGLKTTASTLYESEIVTMNGVTAVTSANAWYRINRVEVITAGSGEGNAGVITVRHSAASANVFAVVDVGQNQSVIAAYTVPALTRMLIKRVRVAITRANGSAGSATITFRSRPPGGVFNAIRVFEAQTGASIEFTFAGGEVIEAGTDVKFRVESVSDNTTVAEAAVEFALIDA